MGAVGGMLGLNGGASGTGYNMPSGTDASQLQASYTGNQDALTAQKNLLAALQQQNGLGNQNQVYGQLQGVASGQGPNPAQAMLNQSTGQNVANQAALMAGQRGASQNVGLMARQAAQQGANLQQQAVGQGASIQAQQGLNALSGAGELANTMAGQQIQGTSANTSAQQGEQGILQGANTANNNIMGQLANTTLGQQPNAIGGTFNKVAGGLGSIFGAEGGKVPSTMTGLSGGPQSMFAQHLNGSMPQMAEGGKVPAMLSPGERFLKPLEAKAVAEGMADPMKVGEQIPGKAKVKGNSYANDTVPKNLDVGGIVIPKSIMESKNPGPKAKSFVEAWMKRNSA